MPYRHPGLIETLDKLLETRHYSPRTREAYCRWVRLYIRYHERRHPREMGKKEAEAFLSWLATDRKVSASTQNQALAALLFLYRHVLHMNLPWLSELSRAKASMNLPVVMEPHEVEAVIAHLQEPYAMMAKLMYGAGLRLLELCRLRVKDLDFDQSTVIVRQGKGRKDRVTVLPSTLEHALQAHLRRMRRQHADDRRRGAGWVEIPNALARKYPQAGREWPWQWVFPATRTHWHAESGQIRRHHRHETAVQRAVRDAVLRAGIPKKVSAHTFRHSFATQLLRCGADIRTVQELLGHASVRTTQRYTHVLNRGLTVISPADRLGRGPFEGN